jgi:ATP-binding cassette, subfamily B, bacterial
MIRPATHYHILAFLWPIMRKRIVVLLIMVAMMILGIVLGLLQPFFYKEAIDTLAETGVHDLSALRHSLLMVFWGVLLGMAFLTLHELSALLLAGIDAFVMSEAHEKVFAHVQHLSTNFHNNTFAGSTIRKIGRGTDAIENMLDRMWFDFFPLFITLIGIIIILFVIAPVLGFVVIVATIIYAPISIFLSLRFAAFQEWTDRQDTRVTASMVDAITGNASVKAFSAERREEARHYGVLSEWRQRAVKTWRYGNVTSWIQFMLMMLIELVLLSFAVWLWYRGEFTAGSFLLIYFYMGRLWGHLQNIGRNVRQYLQASAHLQEMVGLYHLPCGVADRAHAVQLTVINGAIAFRNVTFAYPSTHSPAADVPRAGFPTMKVEEERSRNIFQNFSVDIESGEKIALVGHSGGGKSTFVKLLLRLYDLDSGRIMIDGQNIAAVKQESLRRSIGLMPQDPLLFHRSIAENISYGKPGASSGDIEHVAKLAHAHEFIRSLPQGYDTLVGERGVKLSGGERQRVAIARAILAATPILILDEATSSLDSLSEKYIQEALDVLMRGRTTIVIAHRLSTIKKVDRILVIEDGKIVEEGSHGALIRKKDGVYKRFYDLQAGGFIGE